ncbi:hypothetical protein GCM10009613_65680 [Pseudonocardia kongjuensis]|uniref:Lipocalin-like domain-containing protein n=1 Tax=Pseudonocardia kongjuensis TaxID=102227 RepID=A0ABN1YCE3_9PSEU
MATSGPYRLRSKAAVVLTTTAVLALAGCGSDPAEELTGRWTGTCTDSPASGHYGKPFTIEFKDGSRYTTLQYRQSRPDEGAFWVGDDNSLTLTDSDGDVLAGTFELTENRLSLNSIADPGNARSRPSWCTLTRG